MAEISRNELEHIIDQFTIKNMPQDLAMFFITQDIEYDDIFFDDWRAPSKFYKYVFSYIYEYVKGKIDRGQLDIVVRDVFSKLVCYNYTNKLVVNEIPCRDGFASLLIRATFKYLYKDNDLDGINHLINILMNNRNFNPSVIYDIMMNEPELCHQYILSNIISGEYMTIGQVFELLLKRARVTTMDTIRELVLQIFNNKNLLLEFAAVVYSHYMISTYKKGDEVIVDIKCTSSGERKTYIDNMREFMKEIIWVDAELEFFDFLEETKMTYARSKDMYRAGIYDTYSRWFGSKYRESTAIANMLWYGYEEDLNEMSLDIEAINTISRDAYNILYIADGRLLDGYDLFIRLFNFNRFLMSMHRNTDSIRDIIVSNMDDNPTAISLAIDISFYIFLVF